MANLFEHLGELITNNVDPLNQEDEIFERYGRTVAVVILDSSGFSRVSEEHGILYFLSKLVIMRQIVGPILDNSNNLDFKFEADNVYAVFDHPNDAIRASLKVHEAVHKSKLMLTDSEPFRVCIGIGYGKMLYSESLEGYFGEEMNLASKLGEDIAGGGETLITVSAYEHADSALVKAFEVKSLNLSGLKASYYRLQF